MVALFERFLCIWSRWWFFIFFVVCLCVYLSFICSYLSSTKVQYDDKPCWLVLKFTLKQEVCKTAGNFRLGLKVKVSGFIFFATLNLFLLRLKNNSFWWLFSWHTSWSLTFSWGSLLQRFMKTRKDLSSWGISRIFSVVGFFFCCILRTKKKGGLWPWTKNTTRTFVQGKASSCIKALEFSEDYLFIFCNDLCIGQKASPDVLPHWKGHVGH